MNNWRTIAKPGPLQQYHFKSVFMSCHCPFNVRKHIFEESPRNLQSKIVLPPLKYKRNLCLSVVSWSTEKFKYCTPWFFFI